MAPRFVSPMIRRRPPARQQASDSEQGSPEGASGEVPTETTGDVTNSTTSAATSGDVSTGSPTAQNTTDNVAHNATTNLPLDEEPPEQLVRVAFGTYRQARDYSLVLLSQGIVHRFDRSEEGPFEILVDPEHEARALYQIELYRRENPPRKDNPPMPLAISAQPVWVLLVPVACTLADFGNLVANLHSKGLSDAYKVLHGEWWRTITALTLHGDSHHLASNLVSGYIVLNLLAYRIPLARMAPFLAAASALANFCVALTVQSDYRALGFSTFVFA